MITVETLHQYLQEAEDDLGDLARIVEQLAALQGLGQSAQKANDIAHRWEFRRNKRTLATDQGSQDPDPGAPS